MTFISSCLGVLLFPNGQDIVYILLFQYHFCLKYVQSTIGEISSISDKGVVSNLFGRTMRKLLKLTQEAKKVEPEVSNSMQIDDPTNASSPSLMRYATFNICIG